MGKLNDAELDAMLKRIQDSVEKQTAEQNDGSKNASSADVNTPDELLSKLEAYVGDVKISESDKENSESSDYDISGFEIEPEEEVEASEDNNGKIEPEEVVEDVGDAPAEEPGKEIDAKPETVQENAEAARDEEKEPVLEELEDLPFDIESNAFDAKSEAKSTDIFDELSVDDEDELDEADAANEEAVRQRVEQYVNDTVDSTESLIFFENLDKRVKRVEHFYESADDCVESAEGYVQPVVTEKIDDTLIQDADEDEFDDEALEAVTFSFVKAENEPRDDVRTFIEDRKSLDDADINFALSLGNKEHLENAMGFVKVREARHNFVNPNEKPLVGNVLLDYNHGEYRDSRQNSDLKDGYRREKKKIGRRAIFTALILFVTLFLETVFSYDTVTIPYISAILSNPLYYGIISLTFLAVAIALSAKKLFRGFVGFFTANANYYTTIGFVTSINLLYSFLALVAFNSESIIMMNSICIFSILMCIIGEYMQIVREIRTFELISDDRPKISLERVDRTAEMTRKESFLRSNEFYIDDTNFVGKYFERSARRPENYHTQYTYIVLITIFSLLVAVTAIITTRNFYHFVVALELSSLLCVPTQFLLMGAYQFYILSGKLKKLDSAVIGETIADEYVGNNTIYLEDAEVFGNHGVRVVGLEPYNSFNIIDVHYYFHSVFSKVDGPLKNAFGDVTDKIKLSDNVKLVNVCDGGIEAVVDDKNRIFAGSAEFLHSKGVVLGRATDERAHEKDATCAMYMSVNNALCAKLYLKYAVTHRFEAFIEDMAENRAHIGIRTIDPNITEEMMSVLCQNISYGIKVTRPTLNDLIPIGRRSDSGIITAKNPHMIAKILTEGLKIKRINSVLNILWIIYAVLGILMVIAVSVLGIFDRVVPIYIILYQVIWTVGVAIYIRNKLRNRKSR